MGDTEREDWEQDFLIFSGEDVSLCVFPLWIFRPFAVLKLASHWSHWKASHGFKGCWLDSKPVTTEEDSKVDFLERKSSLRLAFLFMVDGLFLFRILGGRVALPSLVSKEKVKEEPMVMENLNTLPWPASAWQKSRHWVVREELVSLTAVIFAVYFWTFNLEVRKLNMLPLVEYNVYSDCRVFTWFLITNKKAVVWWQSPLHHVTQRGRHEQTVQVKLGISKPKPYSALSVNDSPIVSLMKVS